MERHCHQTQHQTTKEERMKRINYLKRASNRFLEGTRFKLPCDAVAAGERSLEHWAIILSEERELETQHQQSRLQLKYQTQVVQAIRT
jgi:hypothetical protein